MCRFLSSGEVDKQPQTTSQESTGETYLWFGEVELQKGIRVWDGFTLRNHVQKKSMEAMYITLTSQTTVMQPLQNRTSQKKWISNWKAQASPVTSTPLRRGRLHLISGESSSEFSQAFSRVLANSHILQAKAKNSWPKIYKLAQKLKLKDYFPSFHNLWTKQQNKGQIRCDSAA